MDDKQIIDLFNGRSELAVAKLAEKFGSYCSKAAYNILLDPLDAEECVNDAYLKAWQSIPPACPPDLKLWIGKVTRNLALDRFRKENAAKRGGGQITEAIDELSECIGENTAEKELEGERLRSVINTFLEGLSPNKRIMFVRRYWYLDSIKDIALYTDSGESAVKTALSRMRAELKAVLDREEIAV